VAAEDRGQDRAEPFRHGPAPGLAPGKAQAHQ
jgi:hypothetical protein